LARPETDKNGRFLHGLGPQRLKTLPCRRRLALTLGEGPTADNRAGPDRCGLGMAGVSKPLEEPLQRLP
jgi:hypothetical protein